jgi:hypothetical protein
MFPRMTTCKGDFCLERRFGRSTAVPSLEGPRCICRLDFVGCIHEEYERHCRHEESLEHNIPMGNTIVDKQCKFSSCPRLQISSQVRLHGSKLPEKINADMDLPTTLVRILRELLNFDSCTHRQVMSIFWAVKLQAGLKQ